jgi:hypothetical protein
VAGERLGGREPESREPKDQCRQSDAALIPRGGRGSAHRATRA